MSIQRRRYGIVGPVLVLLLLVACGRPTDRLPTATPLDAAALPSPAPAATTTPTAEPRSDGLSDAEARTLDSLTKVDDYPLYTMTYYGPYGSAASAPGTERAGGPAWACSLFAALGSQDDGLVGRNFDWQFSPALLLFTDPADGYASVSMVDIGYLVSEDRVGTLAEAPLAERRSLLEAPYWPFDGMNERGLAVGMAAVPESPMPHDPAKETIDSLRIIRLMLDRAATVDEAVEVLQAYNVAWGGGPALHYLIADASGRAALVEFYEGEMVVLPNVDAWHLATNHLRSVANETGGTICRRYDRLQERLAESGGLLSAGEALDLLSEVAQENTQWSVVYGLDAGDVHVVLGRAYDDVHSFDLGKAGE